jgi:hypothetical protein
VHSWIKHIVAVLAPLMVLASLPGSAAAGSEAQLFDLDRLQGVAGSFELRPSGGSEGDQAYALAEGRGSFRFVAGGIEVHLDSLSIAWARRCAEGRCKGPVRAALAVAGRHQYSSSREPAAVLGFAPIPLAAGNAPAELPGNAAGVSLFIPMPARVKLADVSLIVRIGRLPVVNDGFSFISEYAWIGESGRGDFMKALARAGRGPDPCADLLDPVRRREIGCRRTPSD